MAQKKIKILLSKDQGLSKNLRLQENVKDQLKIDQFLCQDNSQFDGKQTIKSSKNISQSIQQDDFQMDIQQIKLRSQCQEQKRESFTKQIISDIIHQVEQQKQIFQSLSYERANSCECRIAGFKTINKKKVPYLAWLPSLHSYSKLSKASKDDFIKIKEKYNDAQEVQLTSTLILSNEQVDALLAILLQNQITTTQVEKIIKSQKLYVFCDQSFQDSESQSEIELNNSNDKQPENVLEQIQQQDNQIEIPLNNNNINKLENLSEQIEWQETQTEMPLNSSNVNQLENAIEQIEWQETQTEIPLNNNSAKQSENIVEQINQIEIPLNNNSAKQSENVVEQIQQQDNQIEMQLINNNDNYENLASQNQRRDIEINSLKQNCEQQVIDIEYKEDTNQQYLKYEKQYQNNQLLLSYDQWLEITQFDQTLLVHNDQNNQNQTKPNQKLVGKCNKKNRKNRQKEKEMLKKLKLKLNNQQIGIAQEQNDSLKQGKLN